MTVVRNNAELAFIGLGGMGSGMALRLRSAGIPLVVHNRTAAKADPLAAAGARVASSAGEAAEKAPVVFLSLSDHHAVEAVLFGELAGRLRPDAVVVDTSAVSPGYSVDATRRLAAQAGVPRVEAAVVGNPAMARQGELRVFTAGPPAEVDRVSEVLAVLGQEVRHIGPTGAACGLKLAFNLMLGNQVAALAEALAYAEQIGLNRQAFLAALTSSGFSSPTLAFRAQMVRERRYRPAQFRTRLMEKDLRVVVGEAAAHGLDLRVTALAADRFAAAVEAGHGDDDASVLADG
jgi:3-hydroxyisobutyrate dehydrogenase-like beta-hydroxyacid dehydrogenase